MKKQVIEFASALSLILSIGCAGAPYAGTLGADRSLSDSSAQAHNTSGNLVLSLPSIIFEGQRQFEDLFGSISENTSTLAGESHSGLGKKHRPEHATPEARPSKKALRPVPVKRSGKAPSHKVNMRYGRYQKSVRLNDDRLATKRSMGKERDSRPVASTPSKRNFFIGQSIDELSPAQLEVLVQSLESLLETRVGIAFLNTIQWGEGGGTMVIVGGTQGKSLDCQRRIARLNLSGHPKEQGLPNRCFFSTRKYGLSTAAGLYQIVYFRNWRGLRKALALKNFLGKYQAIAALELVRTSKVNGSKVGDGLRALLQGDLDNAIRKGTDPWASSPYSQWRGKHPRAFLQHAREELRKLRNQETFAAQLKRFRRGNLKGSAGAANPTLRAL